MRKKSSQEKVTNIYTSIIGGVDNLSNAPKLQDINFQCYTDSKIQAKNFQIIQEKVGDNKWLESRRVKIRSHDYYNDTCLWIDGRVIVNKNVSDFLDLHADNDFTVFRHPYSKSIHEETERCLRAGILKDPKLVGSQLRKYKEDGFGDHQLMAGGIILRKNGEVAKAINELWWEELCEFPTRDEISLPYVLWKLNLKVKILDLDIFNNPYFQFNARRLGDTNLKTAIIS